MPTLHSIAVIGVGGVGGYFGGKLCRLLGDPAHRDLRISFIARGEHLRAIKTHGLELNTEADGEQLCRPTLATDDFSALPTLDLAIVCVKSFDLPSALAQLAPKLNRDSLVLPLLNGFDVYDRVRTVIPDSVVLPACVYVGTHIERPGRVVQRGGACRILFGPDPQRPDADLGALTALFGQAGIRHELTPQIQTEIWKKFIFISAFGLVTAAHDRTLGEVRDDAALSSQVHAIMREAVAIAQRLGVELPADITATSLAKAHDFPPAARTSFQRDFAQANKSDERDLFAGALLRLGAKLGIATPVTEHLAAALAANKPVD
jgi:2-dehydropantoate 2-reductase